MTTKNKLFSWLGFGKKKPAEQPTIDPQQEALAEAEVESPRSDDSLEAAESESAALTSFTKETQSESLESSVAALAHEERSASFDEQALQEVVSVEPRAATQEQVVPLLKSTPVESSAVDVVSLPEENEPKSVLSKKAVTEPEVQEPSVSEPVAESVTDSVVEWATDPVKESSLGPEAPFESDIYVSETTVIEVPSVETVETPLSQKEESSLTDALQDKAEPKLGFFARLRQGLSKTRQNFGNGLASLFLGKKIDDDLYEELETQLLLADVGVETTTKIISQLTQHANRKQLCDADALYDKLQQEMAQMLQGVEQPLQPSGAQGPYVILMVGVNGVGKTTTIGKMAQQFKQQGKSVMLAAGDTFRAAAVEQLQVWGERNQIPVIAQQTGADSASVLFDAYQAAKARQVDVLIADTAGRLQNKAHLMEELKKIVRVMKKIDGAAPHEVMLTLDAGTGQNALSQAKLFKEAVDITGITLTKLDGTAKGGVIFAIANQFNVPIRYIGVGEGIDDLRVFHSQDFIKALFNREI